MVALLQRQMESMQVERLKDKEAIQELRHHNQALQQFVLMQTSLNSNVFEIVVRAFADKLLEVFYCWWNG